MIDPVKAAGGFHVYLATGTDGRFDAVLAELGLEGTALREAEPIATPAVIVLAPGEAAPEGHEDIAIRPPADAPPAALRELLRVALQNSALKLEVKQFEEQARRQHRQFEELNRIGIALSAERDIVKLQEFILTTMRQLTNADGASLWVKTIDDDALKLFLASSQNFSIDNTYQAFKVPVDEKSVVGYTVTMGTSQIYDDAYNPPPGKPQGGRGFDAQYGYRTKSMLTVPMRNYNNEVIGAVQLINAKRRFDVKLTVRHGRAGGRQLPAGRPGDDRVDREPGRRRDRQQEPPGLDPGAVRRLRAGERHRDRATRPDHRRSLGSRREAHKRTRARRNGDRRRQVSGRAA